MAKLIQLPSSRPANPAEAQVVQGLVDGLPNTYTIIPNAEIAQPGGPPFEYDVIVIAPHALYVVEVKRWLDTVKKTLDGSQEPPKKNISSKSP